MPFIHDTALDAALSYIDTAIENLYITSEEATDFTGASATHKLGTKAAPSTTGPADGDASGRKLTIDAITDGTVDSTGTATHWALCDNSESKLLAAGALDSGQSVTATNTFTLTAFDIEIPDPA